MDARTQRKARLVEGQRSAYEAPAAAGPKKSPRVRSKVAPIGVAPARPLQAAAREAVRLSEVHPSFRRRARLSVHDDLSDEQLVAIAQSGDQRAFSILMGKYQGKVVKLVNRLVGENDAADVTQETFIKAYRAINGFRGQSAFYTWLYCIGVNTAKNHLASRNRRTSNRDIDFADAEQFGHFERLCDFETPESIVLADEVQHNVARAIGKLPEGLRKAVTLREFEGLSYEEIAEVMECPVGTVRSRIFRAREAIDATIGVPN